MYYCNINGFQTKKESIRKIIDKLKPKIIALSETKLASGSSIKSLLPEYDVCSRPTKAGKRDIAICVKLETFKSILDVTTTPHNDILCVRICMADCVVRVIHGYGPQESENAEIREDFFSELDLEITNCEMADELPITVGDMNATVLPLSSTTS